MPRILFDDALPTMVRILKNHGATSLVDQGTIVRDSTGRLAFFSNATRAQQAPSHGVDVPADGISDDLADDNPPDSLADSISEGLGPYARANRPVIYADEPGASRVLNSPERVPVLIGDQFCYLIDRRIVGAGWMAEPTTELASPARLVFASLKGGVGRSTALTVLASDLARRNHNVLVVDLDLEAPGLGHLLLDEGRLPEYGVIDFLVENGLGGIDDSWLREFIGTSHLTDSGGGRVDVMPAIGKRSLASPENVMAKLSRAMLEDVDDEGSISVGQQVSRMIERMTTANSYDAVLIDSRAGLAELAAPAVIGLGATVLLFGTDQKQTIEGYRALFSALQLLAQRDRMHSLSGEWRKALRPVYAKATMNTDHADRFRDDLYDLYSEHLYDAEEADKEEEQLDSLRFTRDDLEAPHQPLIIPFNQSFIEFDPTREPGQLNTKFYETSFRPFLDAVDKILAAPRAKSIP